MKRPVEMQIHAEDKAIIEESIIIFVICRADEFILKGKKIRMNLKFRCLISIFLREYIIHNARDRIHRCFLTNV
jgi:hypothetical protein